MKYNTLLLSMLISLYSISVSAQINMTTCKMAVVSRYTSTGIELRWMPDNKTTLRLGFDNNYSIERSDSGANNFKEIFVAKAYTAAAWEDLISNEANIETRTNLEIAADFLFAKDPNQKKINFEEGIAGMNEQKNKEDLVYAVLVLTAIKDGKVAEALGLGYIDKTAVAGKIYTYRIKLNGESPVYEIEKGINHIKAELNKNQYKNEVFVFPGDKQLSFVWASKKDIAGYFVERAAEGESTFTPLNRTPIYASSPAGFNGSANGSFSDDSLINYKTYRYRFYGNNAFGEKVLFAEAKGMPRDMSPLENPIIYQPKHTKPKEVLVHWDLFGEIGDLKGFIVARSDRDTGNFTILHNTLLSSSARNYSDTTFNSGTLNYYIVYAMDTAGNISASYAAYVALIDSTPPSKPMIKTALIDSLGIVTIKIILNKETDLMGYRLFKSNSPEHEFSVIEEGFKENKWDTNSVQTLFMDTITLQSLTPYIYYRVRALDFNFNQSEFSEIIALKRPDTIPPITPLFNDITVSETKIELHFSPSESIDVKSQILYRKTDLNADWLPFITLNAAINNYIDTNVKTEQTYYYSLRAMDESGLYSSYSNSVYGKPYDNGIRPIVSDFKGIMEDKNIVLKWNYPAMDKEVVFTIYKKDEQGKFTQYALAKEKTFIDKKVGKENAYFIKAMTTDGGKSKMSPIVIVKVEN